MKSLFSKLFSLRSHKSQLRYSHAGTERITKATAHLKHFRALTSLCVVPIFITDLFFFVQADGARGEHSMYKADSFLSLRFWHDGSPLETIFFKTLLVFAAVPKRSAFRKIAGSNPATDFCLCTHLTPINEQQ